MELRDRVAVITGGASGIGRACGLAMVRRGARVVIADVNEARTAETLAEIETLGGWARGFDCDVTRDSQVERLAEGVDCSVDLGRPPASGPTDRLVTPLLAPEACW